MKKLLASPGPNPFFTEVQFKEAYAYYDLKKESIEQTVCKIRTPSGKWSCAAFVGQNDYFYSLKASLHAQDAPLRHVDHAGLKAYLQRECRVTEEQVPTILRYLDKNNLRYLPIFEGEENPILSKSELGEDFPFKEIKNAVEAWLSHVPSRVQCEVRFGGKSYYAVGNHQHFVNKLQKECHVADTSIDCIELIGWGKMEGAVGLLSYEREYGIHKTQEVYVPVLRSGQVEVLNAHIFTENFDTVIVKYGSIKGSAKLNYLFIEGSLMPGDSGAPVIIEKQGKIFYLGSIRSIDEASRGVVTLWGQAEEVALFGNSGKDMIEESKAQQMTLYVEYPLGEYYAYGAANTLPHIHCYASGFHLKILLENKIRRIDIVKDGKLNEEDLKDLLSSKIEETLKVRLLKEVKKYRFDYRDASKQKVKEDLEKDHFKDLEAFKAYLDTLKRPCKIL